MPIQQSLQSLVSQLRLQFLTLCALAQGSCDRGDPYPAATSAALQLPHIGAVYPLQPPAFPGRNAPSWQRKRGPFELRACSLPVAKARLELLEVCVCPTEPDKLCRRRLLVRREHEFWEYGQGLLGLAAVI